VKEPVHIGRHPSARPDPERLLAEVAGGDQDAFAVIYDATVSPVLGVARRVLRNQAQSEEVAQDVLVEVWRTAARYRPERGTAINWILTLAHRRAVDQVRSIEASSVREQALPIWSLSLRSDDPVPKASTAVTAEVTASTANRPG
jgi:RNA polymerase sigma-70 factor (ECF subfamily)